ncbi:prolipoprotein diacylglyceryl transferase [Peptococcus simiae]|uniref:Phosphatidylglycerol--prolipoprotein diacylglyceryl transferase n=1 Tax=Peptococcus simiae TaxID=1643805 RepID=A0ABW9H0N3_9FIRM
MDPIAFQIGPLAVRWYGILIALAFLIALMMTGRGVKKAGLDEEKYYSLVMVMIVMAILGARLYYVVFNWPYYAAHPGEIMAIWHGGLAVHGGLIAGTLTLFLGSRHYGFRFWQLADIIAPWMILGQAIGRWGNYFNREAYGYAVDKADVPWAIEINGQWHHPTFLYESLWDLLGFGILMVIARRPWVREGEVALIYLMYYSVGRFVIEGFRTDSLMLGPLRMAQVISLLLFIGAGAVLLWRRRQGGPKLVSHERKDTHDHEHHE